MAQKLYKKLISATSYEGVCNASDVDMSKQFNGKSYSKVSAIIDAIISFISNIVSTGLKREIVQAFPTENISSTTIYLISRGTAGASGDIYDEYMYLDNDWEHIGSTEIDLTNYIQKPSNAPSGTVYVYKGGQMTALDASDILFNDEDFPADNIQDAITWVREENNIDYDNLDKSKVSYPEKMDDGEQYVMRNGKWVKVQIVTDAASITYSGAVNAANVQAAINELQNALNNIDNEAQKNVQSDWDEDDETSDAFIKHKPDASGIAISGISGINATNIKDAVEEIFGLGVAGRWFTGTSVNGVYSTASVEGAKVGDLYLNTDTTSAAFGNVYRLSKISNTNKWEYKAKIASKATLNETTDAQGYKHVTVSVTSGGKTTTSSDLMAPVNEVLDAIDKIMKPSTASLTASSENE